MRLLISLTLFFALSACGTRGALQLPPGPAPEPLFGKRPTGGAQGDAGNRQAQQSDHSNNPASQ